MATAVEQPTVEQAWDGEICCMNKHGDTPLRWRRGVGVEVDAARAHFDTLKGKGYAAYKETAGGERGEIIRSFDVNAERIVMVPPVSGG